MATQSKVRKVLIIGPGPESAGQGMELPGAVARACQVFGKAAIKTVVVDSNLMSPATEPGVADRTYIEPLSLQTLEQLIEREQPDAVVPVFGGRTAFDLLTGLAERGTLERYRLETLGIAPRALRRADELDEIRRKTATDGMTVPKGAVVSSIDAGFGIAGQLGFPVVVRPLAVTAGTGASLVYNREEFGDALERALVESPLRQVLVEESLEGWQEYECVTLRDLAGACLLVAVVQSVEPVGVHIGDSIKILPARSLTEADLQLLRDSCRKAMDELQLVGSACFRFAYHQTKGQWALININPRYTMLSALADQASGSRLVEVWTQLALGRQLTELFEPSVIDNGILLGTTVKFTAVAVPYFDFTKFQTTDQSLNLTVKSVGETFAFGYDFKEALQKAVRSAGRACFDLPERGQNANHEEITERQIKLNLININPDLLYYCRMALKRGKKAAEIAKLSRVHPWIVDQIAELVGLEKELTTYALYNLPVTVLRRAKEWGFSDQHLARLLLVSEQEVRRARQAGAVQAGYFPLDSAGHGTPVQRWAASYHPLASPVDPENGARLLILGNGPVKLGEDFGLDFAAQSAARSLKELGYQPVLLNSNPRTLAVNGNSYERVYVEPVDLEAILNLWEADCFTSVITEYSGRRGEALVAPLAQAGVKLIDDWREPWRIIRDHSQLKPLLSRIELELAPPETLRGEPGLAVEVIADGVAARVTGTVEQIEEARINLEDSACSIPPYSVNREAVARAESYTVQLARELKVRGLLRARYAIRETRVRLIELNLGASELTPLISKTTGIAWTEVAAKVMMGRLLRDQKLPAAKALNHTVVKEAVFPFNRFPGTDPVLGKEVRSNGAVLGMAQDFGMAFIKAQLAAREKLPLSGMVYLSISQAEFRNFGPIAKQLSELGFDLAASEETVLALNALNIGAQPINQVGMGRPDIMDWIKNGKIQWIISTPGVAGDQTEAAVRSGAVSRGIPITTTLSAALAAVRGLRQLMAVGHNAKAVQDYTYFQS